jgi:hypothetical protein
MQLTKDQKEYLQSLKVHPWFKVLEMIEQDALSELWKYVLLNSDLSNEEHLKVLKTNQIYCKARKDFLQNIENHLTEIYSPDL